VETESARLTVMDAEQVNSTLCNFAYISETMISSPLLGG